jgi:site-specific DNA-methyltransferase (adenine-specific)
MRERLERSRVDLGQGVTLYREDCRFILPTLKNLAACVTDPPYELGFMGRKWDSAGVSIDPATWQAVLASLLPGAHCVAFAGTRTYHRIACAVEDAGFDVRDMNAWVYGSGFPKSLDVSKAIDKEAGAEREVVGPGNRHNSKRCAVAHGDTKRLAGGVPDITAPATEDAARWQGWGTALKPAFEPACLARKPLDQKTVAKNVLTHGTGALNIDACRIEGGKKQLSAGTLNGYGGSKGGHYELGTGAKYSNEGRWPANLCHDGSEKVLALFPTVKGGGGTEARVADENRVAYGTFGGTPAKRPSYETDSGSAARFFYCPKVSPKERGDSKHPTMKPVALMEWLCKLVTPPGGTIVDPFMGSGSTGVAAVRNGFGFIGIESDPESFETARKRIEAELRQHNYRAVYPVKTIEEGNTMSNLLEIAGGKDAILRASHAVSPLAVDLHSVLRLARIRFISTFGADIETRLDTAHQMHILMQGERPQAPSDEADAWDDALIAECDAVTSDALRSFELWVGPVAERWAKELETYSVVEHEWAKGAHILAEFIWREKVETKDSPAKQLSALGITVKEIEAYWASQGPLAASAAPVTSSAPTTSDAWAPAAEGESASPLMPMSAMTATAFTLAASSSQISDAVAAQRGESASPLAPAIALSAVSTARTSPAADAAQLQAASASPVKKTRGRKRAHVALTLPGVIFQTLRSVGISDKTLAEASGISRSTVSRVCAGDQTEIGVSPDEFTKLTEFAAAKMAELQEVLGTLSFFEVGA